MASYSISIDVEIIDLGDNDIVKLLSSVGTKGLAFNVQGDLDDFSLNLDW